jgi:hypothetical protein
MSGLRWTSSAALVLVLLGLQAMPASAADSVYWVDYERAAISHADISGGGAADVPIPADLIEGPYGTALDPAEGKLYWTNWNTNSIGVANIDGSGAALLNTEGATVAGPSGLAIDPATRRIYWANSESGGSALPDTISYANLNGSGGADLNTTGATVSEPFSVAIDPAGGRLYWTNDFDTTDSISYANLDGSGGDDLDTDVTTEDSPIGLAIDGAAHRIYWGNSATESIGSASLAGGEGGGFKLAGIDPEGLALDAAANRVYWASHSEKLIGFSSLSGEGQGAIDQTGIEPIYPAFPALLKTPVNTVAPAITRAPKAIVVPALAPGKGAPPFVQSQNETFECSQGSWAPDLYEASLYRAPKTVSYQWLRNATPIPGATASSYAATEVGDYSCRVTATNGAGATALDTASLSIQASFALGKPTIDRKKGIAKLPIASSGSGVVDLGGRFLKPRTLGSPGPLSGTVVVKAKGRALKRLKAKGKAKVVTQLSFTPTNGSPQLATRAITLRLKH